MKRIFIPLLILAIGANVSAQNVRKVTADKIVGIVGDKIILESDVWNDIQDRLRRGEQVPPEANCYVMEQALTLKALVLQAERDSILVADDEIDALLDNQIRGFIQMYGSKEALEETAGRSVYQIKEDFRQSFKERKLAERMRDKIVENVKITPQEVKDYFDKIPKDSVKYLEAQVEIGQIVLYPKASRDLEKLTIDELTDFKRQVEAGQQKFDVLAQLYSDDPAVKENKGVYNINRTEKTWDPAFLSNAFRLKEGQVSPVFKSKFGYHIIKMISRAGDDAVVQHILRIPKITDVEINEAVGKLDSVRARLIAGTANFGEACSRFSEDEGSKFTGCILQGPSGSGSYLTFDQLDKDMVQMLAKNELKPGGFSKPTPFEDDRKKKGVRIVYLKSRTEPHRENLKDDYDQISQRALEIKKQQVLEKWFQSRLPSYYIMIDDEFKGCKTLSNWMPYAAKNQ